MLLGCVGEAPCGGRPQAILAREIESVPGSMSVGFALLDTGTDWAAGHALYMQQRTILERDGGGYGRPG